MLMLSSAGIDTSRQLRPGVSDTPRVPRVLSTVRRGVRRRCPHCGRGPLFVRWITPHRKCTDCGLVYLRDHGDICRCRLSTTGGAPGTENAVAETNTEKIARFETALNQLAERVAEDRYVLAIATRAPRPTRRRGPQREVQQAVDAGHVVDFERAGEVVAEHLVDLLAVPGGAG